MAENKIEARIVLEMLGRPKEHLVETMEKLVEALSKEKGINILERKINDPKELEEKNKEVPEDKQLYTTFAELDIESEDIVILMGIVFRYMPSHLEIVSPESISFDNFNLNTILNELASRLHYYDSVAKSAIMNNNLLTARLKEIIEKTGYKLENNNESKSQEEPKKETKKSKKKTG